MSKVIKIRKGKDIKLEGQAPLEMKGELTSESYAVKPPDFQGLVPKLEVKEGDDVKAGTVLFHDKNNPDVKFTSPVSGEVTDIVRGLRRAVLEVRVLADKEMRYEAFDVSSNEPQALREVLLKSGLWPAIKQRPFNVLADPEEKPKAVFVSCFDSAPLAPDLSFILKNETSSLQKGIDVLSAIAGAPVYLGLSKSAAHPEVFENLQNAEKNYFEGPHPAGVVGVQIHHIAPINKGEIVWTISPVELAQIGKLFSTGHYHSEKIIALAGSEMNQAGYYNVKNGFALSKLGGLTSDGNNRIIGGNVFTGTKLAGNGYLGYYDYMITVIPEGDQYEFLGWLLPSYPRPSLSKTFPYYLMPNRKFKVNTNKHGEPRPFVVTGEYDKLVPMDVMPVYLLKAILAKDLEAMENLGIYEVVEEDLALCEFACTSKIQVQEILREGLNLMESEG